MCETSRKRFSKQREAILNYLRSTVSHPTANMVYDEVRREIPNISLGTVYRNLTTLTDEGMIIKIESYDGGERYDARITPHSHLFCSECGNVSDIFLKCDAELDEIAQETCGGKILSHNLTFEGVCVNCIGKK